MENIFFSAFLLGFVLFFLFLCTQRAWFPPLYSSKSMLEKQHRCFAQTTPLSCRFNAVVFAALSRTKGQSLPNPGFGVQLGRLLAQLEVQHAVALLVLRHGAQHIACLYLLALLDDDRRQVAID